MKTLTYTVKINKPVDFVFEKIMDKPLYPDWAKAWGEGMTYDGTWEKDSYISFFDTSGQGTKVIIEEIKPSESIFMTHVAMVEAGDKEITELDKTMKKWIGSKENYYFKAVTKNETELKINIVADETFEEMMNAWEPALKYFKEICESY